MMHILLVYAAADGREPAARLAELLMPMGVMALDAGSAAPRETGLVALLTPAAPADPGVQLALQRAAAEGRPLLPLPAPRPAAFPAPADLARILEWRGASPAPAAAGQAAKFYVVNAVNSSIGDHAVTVNVFGQAMGWSAGEVAQLVAALRTQPPGGAMSAAELRGLFADLQAQIQGVDLALRQGFTRIMARFDLAEQRILAPLLARLDEQQAAQTAAILDALESRVFPAEELGQHLAVIQMALAQINARSAQIRDQQLAAAARRAAEIVSDPGLEMKHKLKVTIPLLPILAYEGEFELSSGVNLAEAWQRLCERFMRSNAR